MLTILMFSALFMFLVLFVLSIIFLCISGDKYIDLHIDKNRRIDPTLSAVYHDD